MNPEDLIGGCIGDDLRHASGVSHGPGTARRAAAQRVIWNQHDLDALLDQTDRLAGELRAMAGGSANELTFASASPAYTWLYKIFMHLESSTYPDIMRLECGQVWPSDVVSRRMYLEEFEEAVGDLISLVPPAVTR